MKTLLIPATRTLLGHIPLPIRVTGIHPSQPVPRGGRSSCSDTALHQAKVSQRLLSLPNHPHLPAPCMFPSLLSLEDIRFLEAICELPRGFLGQCWPAGSPLLSQNVSHFPPGQRHYGPHRPCPYRQPAQLGERTITFAFKASQLEEKKNINNKYQGKGFLPFDGPEGEQPGEGWTHQEQSRDPDALGLEHQHFHYELLQKQNEVSS